MPTQRWIAAVVIAASLIGCQKGEKPEETDVKTLKVNVSSSGEITVDGQTATLADVSAKFADLKQANGMVLYHRDNPRGEPHPNAMNVMQLLVDNQLPIRMCAKPDFSE